jgi:hypothetical protein
LFSLIRGWAEERGRKAHLRWILRASEILAKIQGRIVQIRRAALRHWFTWRVA